jgi:nitrate reductase molybdenum cofactor assembly chaperone NarJ/NarW
MAACDHNLSVLQKFGEALTYPTPGYHRGIEELEELLGEQSAQAPLRDFQRAAALLSPEVLEEHYTRAFDLAPQAVPYLSVYLFGAESPQRGQFMAGLSGAYAQAGFDAGNELPDHLAVVLRYAAVAPALEWPELQQWCLPAPVRHMRLALEKASNPYQHLLASLESFLAESTVGEPAHA